MSFLKRILSFLALWLIYVPMAHAQFGKGELDGVAEQAKIKSDVGIAQVVGNLIRTFIGLLGVIFLLLTIYAGYLYLTAQGEEDKVKHAKQTLTRGVIGLLIILSAYAIASFVIGSATASTTAP